MSVPRTALNSFAYSFRQGDYLFFFIRRFYCIFSLLLLPCTYAWPLPPCTSISRLPLSCSCNGGIITESSLRIQLTANPLLAVSFTRVVHSPSPHPSPVVRGLGISTLSHSCYLLSEFSLSPFSGVCIIEGGSCPFPLPALYLNVFLKCPPKLLAFLPSPCYESSYLILICTVTADAAGTGLATFHFDNFPWEIDSPVLFLLLFLCPGHWCPETSSSSLFSSSSFRGSSKGRKEAWPLLEAGDAKPKPLQKLLCTLCC